MLIDKPVGEAAIPLTSKGEIKKTEDEEILRNCSVGKTFAIFPYVCWKSESFSKFVSHNKSLSAIVIATSNSTARNESH
jgi:hypothetical protein